jgi:dGTPase
VRSEIAVLKGLVAAAVMTTTDRQPYYEDQRQLLIELADALLASAPNHLDAVALEAWNAAGDDGARRRVIVDQVASLTDPGAIALHERLRS